MKKQILVEDTLECDMITFTSGFVLEVFDKNNVEMILDNLTTNEFNDYLKSNSKEYPGGYFCFSSKALKEYKF